MCRMVNNTCTHSMQPQSPDRVWACATALLTADSIHVSNIVHSTTLHQSSHLCCTRLQSFSVVAPTARPHATLHCALAARCTTVRQLLRPLHCCPCRDPSGGDDRALTWRWRAFHCTSLPPTRASCTRTSLSTAANSADPAEPCEGAARPGAAPTSLGPCRASLPGCGTAGACAPSCCTRGGSMRWKRASSTKPGVWWFRHSRTARSAWQGRWCQPSCACSTRAMLHCRAASLHVPPLQSMPLYPGGGTIAHAAASINTMHIQPGYSNSLLQA